MLQSGGSAAASGALSAVATKIVAGVLGPGGVAVLQSLQQIRQTALVAATGNGQTALVQGASSLGGRARAEYLRTLAAIFGSGTLVVAVAMIVGRGTIAAQSGLGADRAALAGWLAVPVVLSAAFVFTMALLNALGAIGKLAMVQVSATLAMAAAAWPAARAAHGGRESWLVGLLAFSASVTLAAACIALRGERATLGRWLAGPARWWSWPAARHFFSISSAMAITGLAGSLALVAVRAR